MILFGIVGVGSTGDDESSSENRFSSAQREGIGERLPLASTIVRHSFDNCCINGPGVRRFKWRRASHFGVVPAIVDEVIFEKNNIILGTAT